MRNDAWHTHYRKPLLLRDDVGWKSAPRAHVRHTGHWSYGALGDPLQRQGGRGVGGRALLFLQ